MAKTLILDANAIGYAGHSAATLSVNGMEVQAVYNFLRTLKHVRETFPSFKNVLALWDGKAKFRFDLYPEYKGKRKDTPEKVANKEAYDTQVPMIKQLLKPLGITQVLAPDFEADDLAGFFARRRKDGDEIKFVTGDQDWLQLVGEGVSWIDPRSKEDRHCDHKTFTDYTGYKTAKDFLVGKAMVGDSSDNIGGVPGIGEKSAPKIFEEFGSLGQMIADCKGLGGFTTQNIPKPLARTRLPINRLCFNENGGMDILGRNLKLMNLISEKYDDAIKLQVKVTRGERDMDAFEDLCAELAFRRITNQIATWNRVF